MTEEQALDQWEMLAITVLGLGGKEAGYKTIREISRLYKAYLRYNGVRLKEDNPQQEREEMLLGGTNLDSIKIKNGGDK